MEENKQTSAAVLIGGRPARTACVLLPETPAEAERRTAVLFSELLGERGIAVSFEAAAADLTVRVGKAATDLSPAGAHGFCVSLCGGNLSVAANSQYGYAAARRALERRFAAGADLGDFTETGDGAGELSADPARGGELRILTNNVFGGTKGDPRARMEMLADVYRAYAPDLCAFQEYHDEVRGYLSPLLEGLGYREVTYSAKSVNDGSTVNSTPLFYDPAVLDLLDRGYVWYANIDYDNPVYAGIRGKFSADAVKNAMAFSATRWDYSKGFAWGMFRERRTGKVFLAASTHLWWMAVRTEDDLCRGIQLAYAKEFLLRKADAWLAENLPTAKAGTVPVFFAGDLNMTQSRASYKYLVTDTPTRLGGYRKNAFVNTDDLVPAGEGVKASTNHHREGKFDEARGIYTDYYYDPDDPYRHSLDYIFTYLRQNGTDPAVARSASITDEYALLATDHCPVFADVTLTEKTAAYPVSGVTIGGCDLKSAAILIPDEKPVNEYRTAVLLAEHLWRFAGVKPAVVHDAAKATGECRILIGRALCEKATPAGAHGYAIAGNGKTLEIAAADQYGYEAAQEALCKELFAGTGAIAVTDETALAGDGEKFISEPIERRGTVRLMENNVFGGNTARNPQHVAEQQLAIYRAYAPDAIGFQEYHDSYARKYLSPLLAAAGYAEVTFDVRSINDGHSVNSTPVFYNPETLELLDKGYLWYYTVDYGAPQYAAMRGAYKGEEIKRAMVHNSAGDPDYSKGLTYGIFRAKATGDVFLFGSTHLWWMSRDEKDDICRQVQLAAAKEFLMDRADAWLAANDPAARAGSMPVFLGGDYNMRGHNKSFAAMHGTTPTAVAGRDTRFHNLNDLVPEPFRISVTTEHPYADYNYKLKLLENPKYNEKEPYSRSLDYIFVNHTARPLHVGAMRRIHDLYAYLSSDHCPVFADVSFGAEAGGAAGKAVSIGGVPLTQTAIVLPQNGSIGEFRTAMLLRAHLLDRYGVELPVYEQSDVTRGAAHVLIGKALCRKAAPAGEHGFAVAGNGTTLEIAAADGFGYEAAKKALTETLFTGEGDLAVTDETALTGDGAAFVSTPIARAGEVRMMFHNIYGWSLGPLSRRMQHIAEIYATYHPDVIGCEEYHDNCRAVLSPMLAALGYREVDFGHTINDGSSYNSTPLFYDPAALELLDKGYYWYYHLPYGHPAFAALRGPHPAAAILRSMSKGRPDYSKGLTWGIFRVRATGHVFLAASTHLWWKYFAPVDGVECADEYCRGIQFAYAKELLLTRADLWLRKHDPAARAGSMPVFLGGDYNDMPARIGFGALSAQTPSILGKYDDDGVLQNPDDPQVALDRRFVNVNDLAPADARITFKTHHGYAAFNAKTGVLDTFRYCEDKPYEGSIDYIYTNRNTAAPFCVDRMACVHDTNAYASSDHNPIFADVTFTGDESRNNK